MKLVKTTVGKKTGTENIFFFFLNQTSFRSIATKHISFLCFF